MMGFLHLYMQYTQTLFVQAVMAFKTLYDSKVFKIHVLGQPAEGDLKRPFKVGGMFGGMSSSYLYPHRNSQKIVAASSDPQTDKAAIDEAEKKIGKKEE